MSDYEREPLIQFLFDIGQRVCGLCAVLATLVAIPFGSCALVIPASLWAATLVCFVGWRLTGGKKFWIGPGTPGCF